jgi:hypothetical protein
VGDGRDLVVRRGHPLGSTGTGSSGGGDADESSGSGAVTTSIVDDGTKTSVRKLEVIDHMSLAASS